MFSGIRSFLLALNLLVACSLSVWAQPSRTGNETLNKDSAQHRIARQVLLFPQEKLYIHTDRALYVAGESVWFRAYLVDAVLHTPSVRQAYLYVDLINPKDSVVSRVLVKQQNGAFSGSLTLPDNLVDGDYVLRAYPDKAPETEADNFRTPLFHKKICLLGSNPARQGGGDMAETSPTDTYALSFFPEGGYLVEGVNNRVAFKALFPDGSPAQISGRLRDRQGRDYGSIETLHGGMGRFEITPMKNTQYFVVTEDLNDPKEFVLPEVGEGALALQTTMADGELRVSVLRSADAPAVGQLYLLLHTRGMVHYMEPWDDGYPGIAFETADFPSGVVQVLLLDAQTNPLSERLVFCRNNDDAMLEFAADQESYGARSPVKASVRLTDGVSGQPISGSFSVSVTDDRDLSPDEEQNILASLLLGSELRGNIPDPAHYLRPENHQALDILMMTHGWKRYNIPQVIRGRHEQPAPAAPHKGLTIKGTVTTDGSRKRPLSDLKVSILSWQADYSDETLTDSLGRFAFRGLEFADSLTFVVQAETPKWRNHPRLTIEKEPFPSTAAMTAAFMPQRQASRTKTDNESGGIPQTAGQLLAQQAYLVEKAVRHNSGNGMRAIEIEEVQVEAKLEPQAGQRFSYYMPKDRNSVLTSEQLEELQPNHISDALKYIPFITVSEGQVYINRYSRLGPAILIIDDIIINNVKNIDDMVEPFNIERIGILRGGAISLLGGQGRGGAVVITTKKGLTPDRRLEYERENVRIVNPLGLQQPVEFYSPEYKTAEKRNQKELDFRTTIYWNPDVKIPSSGQAGFDFYTADTKTTYTVVIEGVADNGRLIRKIARVLRN